MFRSLMARTLDLARAFFVAFFFLETVKEALPPRCDIEETLMLLRAVSGALFLD